MSLDIILGPMFAGKSSRILSIVSRYASLGMSVLVVKHASDVRYGNEDDVITHDQRRVPCICVDRLDEIPMGSYQVIIVDEAHFFSGLVNFVKQVVDQHQKGFY